MFNQKKDKGRKGFTLVELIVVIGILAVLSIAAVVAYGGIQKEARRSALKSDAGALVSMLNMHNAVAVNQYTGWAATSGADWTTGLAPWTATTTTQGIFNFSTGIDGASEESTMDPLNGALTTDPIKADLTTTMSGQHAVWCVRGTATNTVGSGVVQYVNGTWAVTESVIITCIP